MSMFISKALRRAEVFLEQVDDRVAQASRRLAVEGATGYVEDDEYASENEEGEGPSRRRAAEIARPKDPTHSAPVLDPQDASRVAGTRLENRKGEHEPTSAKTDVSSSVHSAEGQGAEIGSVPANTGSNSHDTSALSKNSESAASGSDPIVQSQLLVKHPPQNPARPRGNIPSSTEGKGGSVKELNRKFNATATATTAAAASSEISVPEEIQPQSAAAKFLMGINKARETAGSLLGESLMDDNKYISELQTENSELRKELEQIEEDFEDLRKDRSKMVKNLKRMKEIVSEMDDSLQEKSTEARRLESELVEARDEIRKLQNDMKASNVSDKEALESLRTKLNSELQAVRKEEVALRAERSSLVAENQSLREALKSGQDMELAISTGARKEAMEAHHAYETEVAAHRETKRLVKEREESLEAQTALAAKALAAAERKADECLAMANAAKTVQRAADAKLNSAVTNREIAFARIQDLERTLRRYEGEDGAGPPGKEELESLQVTISELENALETKNVN